MTLPINNNPRIWLFRPWFCDEKNATPQGIQTRYKELSTKPETTPSWIKSTTPATSLGIGAAIIGVLGFLIGSGKENGFGKFLGGLITIAGLVLAGIGKFKYGVDLTAAATENPGTNPTPADSAAQADKVKLPVPGELVLKEAPGSAETPGSVSNETAAQADEVKLPVPGGLALENNDQTGAATDALAKIEVNTEPAETILAIDDKAKESAATPAIAPAPTVSESLTIKEPANNGDNQPIIIHDGADIDSTLSASGSDGHTGAATDATPADKDLVSDRPPSLEKKLPPATT